MVQRLTYRTRHSYATKSNQTRVVKTPGKDPSLLVFQSNYGSSITSMYETLVLIALPLGFNLWVGFKIASCYVGDVYFDVLGFFLFSSVFKTLDRFHLEFVNFFFVCFSFIFEFYCVG